MPNSTNKMTQNEDRKPYEWTPERINCLLHAMKGYRPVGIGKHFHMMFIFEKLRSKSLEVTPEDIWELLSEYYNLKQLNEMQPLAPPLTKVQDFSLPSEFKSK